MQVFKSLNYTDNLSKASQELSNFCSEASSCLLLVSGGSSIAVAQKFINDFSYPEKIKIGLVDERFGQPMHNNSNWNGLLEIEGIDKYEKFPMLEGKNAEETTQNYEQTINKQLDSTEKSIGLLGLGEDGRIAGMLPSGPEEFSNFLSVSDFAQYHAKDFHRITATDHLLSRLDEIIVFGNGTTKFEAIEKLLKSDMSVHEFPGCLLKRYKNVKVYISNIDS